MKKPEAIALFSGGKDSVYSLQTALLDYNVVLLVSFITNIGEVQLTDGPEIERGLFIDLIKTFDIPYELVPINNKEDYLDQITESIRNILQRKNISVVITGDLDHPDGIDKILIKELGITCISPAGDFMKRYGSDTYVAELARQNILFILSGIRNDIISENYIGKSFNVDLTSTLKNSRIDITGEDGEFQTLVIDAPNMSKRLLINDFSIEISKGRDQKNHTYAHMVNVDYSLEDKI